ncbi:Eukaryotic translation initiation factor 4 gamma [Bulinus truncatus]|nr:Eukaryotic translation initiation factor 4 gamma [Bulinus truncatus]
MQARGHQSISPPEQISHSRHGNQVSNTPPPQAAQFYPQAYQQRFEFIPQQQDQSLLQYKAYGSALNEPRAPGNGARVVPPQPNIQQPSGNFYPQATQTMRPPQPQQGPSAQQYFISTPAQPRGIRPQQQMASPTTMVYLPQPTFPGNNVVIPANMYHQRVPQYQPVSYQYATPNYMYYQPNGWANSGLPQPPANTRPADREKKILSITDPVSGRDVTSEIFSNKNHPTDSDEHRDDTPAMNQSDQEICKTFTRLVADRLKAPDETSSTVDAHITGATPGVVPATTQPSQYQQSASQVQHSQQSVSRSHTRPALIHPAGSATPPQEMPYVDTTIPPPNIRPSATMYNTPQQPHVNSRISQPLQQRPQMAQIIPGQQPSAPNVQVTQATLLPQQSHMPQGLSSDPLNDVASSAPLKLNATKVCERSEPEPSKPDIPAKPVSQVQAVKATPANLDGVQTIQVEELATEDKLPLEPVKEKDVSVSVISQSPDEVVTEELSGSNVSKDGKKNTNNKKKKDINRKEIAGSEMDAFIDKTTSILRNFSLDGESGQVRNPWKLKPGAQIMNPWKANYVPQLNPIYQNPFQFSGFINPFPNPWKNTSRYLKVNSKEAVKDSLVDSNQVQSVSDITIKDSNVSSCLNVQSDNHCTWELDSKCENTSVDLSLIEETKDNSTELYQVDSSQIPFCRKLTSDPCENVSFYEEIKPAHCSVNIEEADIYLEMKQSNKAQNQTDAAPLQDKENETVDTVAKSSTSSPAEEEKQCKDNLTKEVKPASGVGTEIQKAAAKEVITTSGESCDLQSKTVIRLSETEIEKPATFEKSVSPADISPTDSVVDLPQSRIEDVVQNNQIEGSNDLSSSAVDKTYETTIQITKINENEIIKDSILKSHDEGRKISNSADNSANNKTSSESTPLRTDGKETRLQYDRARLMELRDCPISQIKPEGLPNLEIIMDSPNSSSRSTTVAPDFTPNFFQPTTSNQRHPPSMGKTNSRGRQRPGETTRIINIKPNLTNDKPLHQSEKPWKPTQKLVYAGEISEKRKTLESDVLFIMNRLTPTNFDRLAQEMRNLNIQTYEDLTDLVKIFFDKVTMETKFVEAYAQLCKFMSSIKVPPPPGMKENQSTFRVVMLTKCQQEFEADKSIIFEDPEEKKKKIESEMPEGNERNEKIESTLYQMKLKRLKFYGNIRFIGELFKLGMLTENIMHDCIYRLLKARDDDSLVSLCQLLTTVGHVLDTEKAKTRMDQYFNQMAKIAEERKSRIKFTLKDAIDLRSNNWVPRKEQTGPKKIDEVHKDYQQEQYTKQLLQSQPPPPRADTVQPNSRRGSRQRQDELKQSQDDGWNTVGSKSLRIDASKMKLSKNVVDENNIQLGPGGGVSKFSIWGRGSYGGSQPSQEDRPPPSNRFSLLRGGGGGGAGEEDRRNYQKSPSRGDNVASRGIRQAPTAGHGRGKILSRSITEGERREGLSNTWPVPGGRSQNSSRDNSWNREEHRTSLSSRSSREGDNVMTRSDITLRPTSETSVSHGAAPTSDFDEQGIKKIQPLSEKEMEHKAKTILEEYLNVMDLEEAKLCVKELKGQAYLDVLVSACINDILEKSKQKRAMTGQFFHEMVRNKLIPLDIYLKGLSEVLLVAEDMVIDIPMIWSYLAQLITPMLLGGSVPWSNLVPILKDLNNKCSGKLLAEILLIAKELKGENETALLWQASGLSWSVFMDDSEVDKFLHDKKLDFTSHPVKASLQSKTSLEIFEKITDDMERIAKENGSNADILAYIEKNVLKDMQQKELIRALTTAVASSSITSTKKPNEEAIKNCIKSRKDVLQQFIKSNVELELQALYAIQALMHKLEHPSNVIVNLFDALYDEDIISDEACKKWEVSNDPQELEGKGACLMQLTQFFAWLKENEDPEPS